ncbi:DNA-binding GntR family transcriptional regulator [Nocardia sp. GAS34]|uniref:FCD domain-containing protein n=1 Tax=unclassified Nocardia TaxID=2637762 RepID=UPI003D24007E
MAGFIDTVSVFGWAAWVEAVRAMHTDDPAIGSRRIRDHREILAALRAGDSDQVEALMRRHLIGAIDYLTAHARVSGAAGDGAPS